MPLFFAQNPKLPEPPGFELNLEKTSYESIKPENLIIKIDEHKDKNGILNSVKEYNEWIDESYEDALAFDPYAKREDFILI